MPWYLLRIDHLDPVDDVALALGDGLLGRPPVHRRDVVLIALRGGDLELAGGALAVVRAEEHPPIRRQLAGVAEVVVERRHQDLPGQRHLAGSRVDLDAGDDALVIGGVLVDPDGPVRHRDGEAGGHHRVFGVRRDERRGVIAVQVRDRPEDLLGLEVAQVDARDAPVHLVDEQPAPVVIALGLR